MMDKKPGIFEFTSYKFDREKKRIFFSYKQEFKNAEPLVFTESIILPANLEIGKVDRGLIDKILQGLHLALGVSYYKMYAGSIVRHPYALTKGEANFWNIVYRKGLGEFYFKNNLNPKKSPKFSFDKNANPKPYFTPQTNKSLVCIGGGKDSLVALELLKEAGKDIIAVFTETQKKSEVVDNLLSNTGVDYFKVQRFLDWQTSQQHEYAGHIPISTIYAFLGVLYSALYGFSYCIVSNEHSSNFGNIKYKGEEINHQWSKSSEFEKLFSEYIENFVTPDIKYFSLLRPFYEIRIARMFSRYSKYFSHFTSCNKNFKITGAEHQGLWCGKCAKCVFVFNLLAAFLPANVLTDIFDKNLYQDEFLLPLFRDVLGFGNMKPFDCVGTFEESRAAMFLAKNKFKNDFIVKILSKKIKNGPKILESVFKTSLSPGIPAGFKLLGMKSALILGYGKEGKITKEYVKKFYPGIKIGIADQKQGKNYLGKQVNFDIAVKTPGIPKELVKIPYTTATNLFFAKAKELGVKIIGVTGSKGKSTTASLIFEMLKKGGKNVSLLGNIGTPMLSALLSPPEEDKIFVLELSSYQLDDIEFSPHVAVVTNLFPEHMDYHGSEKNYYFAKKNIINFQNPSNYFVFNQKNKILSKWAAQGRGLPVVFADEIPVPENDIPLIGEHNKDNIKAAIAVAKIFEISEQVIANAIKSFSPLPHRLEFVGEFNGIKFYDDAISTTPESTIMAIKSLPNIETIFLGGQDRGYNFLELEKTVKKYKIKNVVLFPDSGKRILKNASGLNILKTSSMEEAVKFTYKNTGKDKICLLSCASPSYSLWKSFEKKGDKFKKAVKKFSK